MHKKILYIIRYDYLSSPIFNSLAVILGGEYKHIVAYFNDAFIQQNNINILSSIEGPLFDEILIKDFDEIHYANSLLRKRGGPRNYFRIVQLLKRYKSKINCILSQTAPDIIVGTTDLSFVSNIVSNYAIEKGIPFVLIQPSFLLSPPRNTMKKLRARILYYIFKSILGTPLFNRQEQWGDESSNSIKLIWGEKFNGLIKSQNVYIVGNPAIRNYRNIDYTNGKKTKARLGIKNETPVITICTEGFGGMINEQQVNDIYKETILNTPEYHFIIKVHPRDEISFYEKYFGGKGSNNISVLNEMPLLDIYSFTDVQISVNSYSSLEAILCGIPVILVKRELMNQVNYFDDSVILNANDSFSLSQNLHKCISNEYKNEFLINKEKFISKIFDGMNPEQSDKKIRNVFNGLK